jgi:hypothetical protein
MYIAAACPGTKYILSKDTFCVGGPKQEDYGCKFIKNPHSFNLDH